MTYKEAKTQLEDLILDRKSFLSNDKETNKIFQKDIDALEYFIKTPLNDQINELNNKIDAQDKIINTQVLEIANLKEDKETLVLTVKTILKEKEKYKQTNKQLKYLLKNKPDTKWTLTTEDGKELTIIQSERIDMQEELNNTITELFNQLKNKDSILTELEKWLNLEISIHDEDDTIDILYNCVLDKIQKLKEKYK